MLEELINAPAPRALASLTDAECRECFLVAFGHTPKFMGRFLGDVTCIRDWDYKLYIGQDGTMSATEARSGQLVDFNAPDLIDYLRDIGIVFE